ncbi:MAG: cellulose synthase operon protein YhjQ [Burkholderiales bacterium]|nr:cellulose synthase operon protein YhjQ [Burkholderiales bacterium]
MKSLAILSTVGGAGRTTVLAHMATAFSRLQRPVVAIDLDPQNALGVHLGISPGHTDGWALRFLAGEPIGNAALWADGVHVLPFGRVDGATCLHLLEKLSHDSTWLLRQLGNLAVDQRTLALLDAPPLPSPFALQALEAANVVAALIKPDALTLRLIDQFDALHADIPAAPLIFNCNDPASELGSAVYDIVRDRFAARCVPEVIHTDSAVAEALAADASLFDYAPHSQAAHDMHGLSRWLLARIDAATEVPV